MRKPANKAKESLTPPWSPQPHGLWSHSTQLSAASRNVTWDCITSGGLCNGGFILWVRAHLRWTERQRGRDHLFCGQMSPRFSWFGKIKIKNNCRLVLNAKDEKKQSSPDCYERTEQMPASVTVSAFTTWVTSICMKVPLMQKFLLQQDMADPILVNMLKMDPQWTLCLVKTIKLINTFRIEVFIVF